MKPQMSLVELIRQHCGHRRVIAISENGCANDRLEPDATVSAKDGPKAILEAVAKMDRGSNPASEMSISAPEVSAKKPFG